MAPTEEPVDLVPGELEPEVLAPEAPAVPEARVWVAGVEASEETVQEAAGVHCRPE
jgi:hypothetical protein